MLKRLAQDVVGSGMFDTSDAIGPLRHELDQAASAPSAAEGASTDDKSVFSTKFEKWKVGRKGIRAVKDLLVALLKPFANYAVEWATNKRGRAHGFGRRTETGGGFYQGEWDSATGLRSGAGMEVCVCVCCV